MQRWEANIANSQEKRTPSFKLIYFQKFNYLSSNGYLVRAVGVVVDAHGVVVETEFRSKFFESGFNCNGNRSQSPKIILEWN